MMPSIVALLALLGSCSDDPQQRARPVFRPFNIEAIHRDYLEHCRRRIAFMESMIAFEEGMSNEDPRRFPVEQARRTHQLLKDEVGKMRIMLRENESWTPPPGGMITNSSQLEELDEAIKRRKKLYYQLWPPVAPPPREKK